MNVASRVGRLFLAALLALSIAVPAGAGAVLAHTAHSPASAVTIAGSLQSELGCSGDWQADCAATHLAFDASDGVWQATFAVPEGFWEYKATINDSWAENYGANATFDGANIGLMTGSPTNVKFYYDHLTHWITSNQNARIVTAPGNFQTALGCAGDWDPTCLRSWLQDPDGDGMYRMSTTSIPAGSYEVKATINESWDENYGAGGAPGGANILFNVPAAGSTVAFTFASSTNVLSVDVTGPVGAGHDNDIWWADLGHDSRDGTYRTPAGAVTTGTPVTLRLRAASGDLTAARVRVWNDRTNSQSLLDMSIAADDGTHEWWEATVPASSQPTIHWYRFIALDGTASAYYEDDAARTGGWGETFGSSPDNSWQLTVYDPGFTTPDWVKNAVIYQIFPDRFRDGDSSNNTPAGQFFYGEAPTVVRSGGSDWNTPICDPRNLAGSTGNCADIYSQNFYGGDLAGILEKLGYLENLGITAIYLNPIFESPSNHKYDTTDFSKIDPAFGDETLLSALVSDMSSRGMRLILDGVFNHTSSDSIYFDRYGNYPSVGACESATSDFRGWYHFTDVTPGTGECVSSTGVADGATYESWFGFDSLPKLNSANSEVRDLFYAGAVNPIGPYWLTWADGWRLDVAGDVDPGVTNDPSNDFWEGFRDAVRAADSDAYIVGEEWGMATAWTLGTEWDATMNYQLSSALLSLYRDEAFVDNDHNSASSAGVLSPISPAQFTERVLNLQERYPPEAFAALMNLLGSHDTNRPLFMLDHNADLNSRALYEDQSYDWSDAIARLKGVAVLQATLPGAPTIYYGDEIGLVAPPSYDGSTWQDDPYNRIPYPWLDESGTPYYTHLQSAAGQANLLDHYTAVLGARNDHAALRTGDLRFLDTAVGNVLAYGRRSADGSDAAIVVVNRGASAANATLDVSGYLAAGAQLTDLFTSTAVTVAGDGTLSVAAAAGSYAIYLLDAPMSAPPAAVSDLAVAGTGSASIALDWSMATGADSYDVYRSALSGGGYEVLANTTSTDYTDSGVATGATFHYVVVSRDDTTLLTSGNSNEVSATTGYDLSDGGTSWFNLQWPPSMTHTISTTDRTDTAYAQIWIDGVTDSPGQAPGIRAQLGFGADGSQPDASWTWSEMTFNTDAGNNDEYMGSMLPDSTGSFDYAVRWSGDNGASWVLADLDGPQRDGTLDNPGALTVNAATDATAPSTPALELDAVDASSVSLSWTASSDDVEIAGYEVFRDGVEIAEVDGATTTYVDESVTTGQTYGYTVRAFDSSFNRSAASNEVEVTVENRLVDVTFTVSVPDFTPAASTVYVTGSIPELGPWNPSANPMTDNGDGTWSRTFQIPDGTSFEWKYTRGNWETVENWGSVVGVANRGPVVADYGSDGTMAIDNTATDWGTGPDSEKAVQNWRDPLVVGFSPADGATDVDPSTTVVVDWSRQMAASSDFSVSGPDGAVAGTFALSNTDTTLTFTPSAPLDEGALYEVAVRGEADVEGNQQQVPTQFSFTIHPPEPVHLASITVTPADPTIRNGRRLALTATGHYSDGSTADLTDEVDWSSSDPLVVSVADDGTAHGRTPGSAVVTASFDELSGQTTVTVAAPRRGR